MTRAALQRLLSGASGIDRRSMLGLLAAGGWVRGDAAMPGPTLARGVNLSHWFEYERSQGPSSDELQALRRAGFDHVRIPFDPWVLGWKPAAGPDSMSVGDLLRAGDAALEAGLDVVLDQHMAVDSKQAVEDDRNKETALVALWSVVARSFARFPSDRVAIELFNEPQYYGAARWRWPGLQRRLLAAVRAVLPRHLVLLTGGEGSSVEGLQALEPVPDPCAAYVFHFYLPYLFTHQGAEWLNPRWTTAGLHRDVRYPASVQRGMPQRLSRPHPRAATELARYLHDDWGRERIAASIKPAIEWARRHRVRLVCNEFGVIRAGVDAPSRYRWLSDVRSALEAEGVGWTVWDYTDIFGITAESSSPGPNYVRRVELAAMRSLGLTR